MRMLDELFTFDGYDVNEVFDIQFYNAKFLKDFGLFEKNLEYGCISIDFEKGFITSWDVEGQVEFKQKFNIHPEIAEVAI